MKHLQGRIFFWGMLLSIYIFAWMIQNTILIRSDVSIFIDETIKFLSGATYGKDFYDPNPPLVFYLSIPPVLMMKLFHLSMFLSWRFYVFFLVSLSLLMCQIILGKIFCKQKIIIPLLILTLAAIFLLLPLGEWGQRDDLSVIFTLPYFFLLTCRLENKSVNKILATLIGILASIGFAIKPHYVLTFFVLECYAIYYQRNILAWVRLETLLVISLISLYVLSIFIFQPQYVFKVVPLISKVYYLGVETPWSTLLFYPNMLYCFLPVLLFMIFYPTNSQKTLSSVLLVGLLSYLGIYILQDSAWYYHILPAFSLALFLLVLQIVLFLLQPKVTLREYCKLSLFAIFIMTCAIFYKEKIWIAVLFFHWKNLLFCMLVSLALLACALILTRQANRYRIIFSAVLIITIFSYPIFETDVTYRDYLNYAEQGQTLIQFLKNHAKNQSVYFLSSQISAYPFIDYAGVDYASRYFMLIWVPAIAKKSMPEIANYYIGSVGEELTTRKPAFVFVDVSEHPFCGMPYDYIARFSENHQFKKAWQTYQYFTTVEESNAYKFSVYRRVV